MQTSQCGNCARYRGSLSCDKYPDGIPEAILTGAETDMVGYLPISSFLKKAFEDFTLPIAERDGVLYERVKKLLCRRGYQESDFLEGGQLEGFSSNQLLEICDKA